MCYIQISDVLDTRLCIVIYNTKGVDLPLGITYFRSVLQISRVITLVTIGK